MDIGTILSFINIMLVSVQLLVLILSELKVANKLGLSSFGKPTLTVMTCYTVCLFTKIICEALWFNVDIVKSPRVPLIFCSGLNMIADTMTWGMLFYFIF